MVERSKTAEDKMGRAYAIAIGLVVGAIVVAGGFFAWFVYQAWRFFNG